MKLAAQDLQNVVKVLSAIKTEHLTFAGSLAYAVSPNIIGSVLCPEIGTFGVGAEKFGQVVSRLSGEIDVKLLNGLGIEELNPTLIAKVLIKGKGHKLTLPILAAPQIPKIVLPLTAIATLAMTDFLAMITYASSASDDQIHAYTGSVLVSADGQIMRIAGSDGKRIAWVEGKATSQFSFTMPVQVIQALKNLRGEVISVYQDSTSLYFRCGSVTIIARQLAKDFPNYNSIIPKDFTTIVSLPAAQMKEALRRVYPLVDNETGKCQLKIDSNRVTINVSGISGSAEDSIEAESIESDPLFDEMEFVVNHAFLQDFFNEVSGNVLLKANDSGAPIYFECGAKKLLCMTQRS
jgi:DNA polymerase III sliding clamp (beta) subunit (PCNA family)